MLVLKKNHVQVVEELERQVIYLKDVNDNRLEKIEMLTEDLQVETEIRKKKAEVIEKLELKNCELNTKLLSEKVRAEKLNDDFLAEEAKVKQLEQANHELHQEILKLEKDAQKHKAIIHDLGRVYNAMNRKLWCNDESKRQLRKLAEEIREADKINKNYIARYLEELSLRIGGGENFEFFALKEVEKEENEEVVG